MIRLGPIAPTSTPNKSDVTQFPVCPRPRSRSHRADSGTNRRKKKVRAAGRVPSIIMSRQPLFATSILTVASGSPRLPSEISHCASIAVSPIPMIPTNKYPALAAAPIKPAISARERFGQTSITRATPSDHSPPIPRAAINRNTPNCSGVWANPQSPVNNA